MDSQTDALYCVLGQLYFEKVSDERQAAHAISEMRKSFEAQLGLRDRKILELEKQT